VILELDELDYTIVYSHISIWPDVELVKLPAELIGHWHWDEANSRLLIQHIAYNNPRAEINPAYQPISCIYHTCGIIYYKLMPGIFCFFLSNAGHLGAPSFPVGAVDMQSVMVAILKHEVVYDGKHHSIVVAAIADGQDGNHIQLIISWVGPRQKVDGWRTWPCPINEIVTIRWVDVFVREGDIKKCQTSCRTDDTRPFGQTLAPSQVVAANEAAREGRRITELEGHLDGEALATLGFNRI
jgi:hypothetical protein